MLDSTRAVMQPPHESYNTITGITNQPRGSGHNTIRFGINLCLIALPVVLLIIFSKRTRANLVLW